MNNNYILLIALLFLVFTSTITAQPPEPRNMVWLRGAPPISNTLLDTRNTLNGTYDFEVVNYTGSYDPYQGVIDATNLLASDINSKPEDDILVVAHCYGGVISRHLQHQSTKINGMITIGTPHNGSTLIERLVEVGPNVQSDIERLIDNISNVNEADNCEVCDIYTNYKTFISEIKDNISWIGDVAQGSQIIHDINNQDDKVPIINIVGNDYPINRNGLASIIDSRTDVGTVTNDLMVNCMRGKRAEARKALKEAEKSFVLNTIFGVFSRVIKFVSTLAEGDPGDIAGGVVDFLESVGNDLETSIQEFHSINKEAARYIRCDYANSLLSIAWNKIMTNGYQGGLVESTREVRRKYRDCLNECKLDMAWGDWRCNCTCEEYCEDYYDDTETIIVQTYEFNGHDWIYTVGEQELESAMQVGESIEVKANHFEESSVNIIPPYLQDIFDGAYGVAFEVPKN